MNIYTDQNFLINCAQRQDWRSAVLNAHHAKRISVVLSPWHFFEYGNAAAHSDADALSDFADELQPTWILERGDLQQQEFIALWNNIWAGASREFNPIRSLAEVGSSLNRVPMQIMARFSFADYIRTFSAPGALRDIQSAMDRQEKVAAWTLNRYVNDKRFGAVLSITELYYVAVRLARLKEIVPHRVYAEAHAIMRSEPLSTQVQCFVYWRCIDLLKAYRTELALSMDHWETGGKLRRNTQVDRQHAIVALPYCEKFVTDDNKLKNRCERVKTKLRFPTAEIITGDALIRSL